MDKLRQWMALTVVAMLVVAAGGWFLLIAPKRTEAADIRDQATVQQTQNKALQTQISVLKSQAKSLPQKQAKLAAVAAKIPDNSALPTLIRALIAAADSANVELVSLSPGQPVAVTAATAPVTLTPATPGAAGAAAAAPASSGVTSASAGTLKSIGITMSVVGGYFQVEQFFDQIESLSRAMKVASMSLSPGTNPVKVVPAGTDLTGAQAYKTLAASITATVFMASGRTTTALPSGKPVS